MKSQVCRPNQANANGAVEENHFDLSDKLSSEDEKPADSESDWEDIENQFDLNDKQAFLFLEKLRIFSRK